MKLAWELTRKQYFIQIATRVQIDNKESKRTKAGTYAFPMYRLTGIPKGLFIYQQAWDYAALHKEVGQFWIVARQIERTENMKYLTPDLLVEYLPMWKKFFKERPHLQTSTVVSNRKLW